MVLQAGFRAGKAGPVHARRPLKARTCRVGVEGDDWMVAPLVNAAACRSFLRLNQPSMGRANGPVKEVAVASVSSVLADHVSLRVASVDRLGIAGYIPKLSYEGGLVKFLLHRAAQARYAVNIPSPALLGHNHDRMVAELERFVAAGDVPVVRFKRGEVKEDIARPYQLAAAAAGREAVVLVGKAQERQMAWSGYVDRQSKFSTAGHPHFRSRVSNQRRPL